MVVDWRSDEGERIKREERSNGVRRRREQRAKRARGGRKKELILMKIDPRGIKVQFYKITFNKFHSRIMLPISEKE